ncbi:hypothetical protein ACN28I_03445 [Archangium gephyra]|uniref:hypothetical protein n=1 Tax=Archangium gephyra TaxID=48 RepID=UPI003B7D222C
MMPKVEKSSPTSDCLHPLSTTAIARTMSSSRPHLHAPHWRISSVVPVKSPSILPAKLALNSSLAPSMRTPGLPRVWLAVALPGRGSHEERRTRPAHSAPEGSSEPGGSVPK